MRNEERHSSGSVWEKEFTKSYLFAGTSLLAGPDTSGFEAGTSVFAAGASVEAGASAGASGFAERTETLPVSAGIASSRAESINTTAALIVTFDNTVAVPRGANAELDTLLVNNAPASVLPGCNKTAATNTRHERKNNPYKM
jgi:hypothetical protein